MKLFSVLFLLSALLFNMNQKVSAQVSSTEYDKILNQFTFVISDSQKVADVSNYSLRKDAGIFNFEKGKFYSTTPINGRVHALVFAGNGEFLFTPPNEVEKEQLKRFYSKKKLQEKFNFLVLFFADSTFQFISSKFDFKKGLVTNGINDYLKDGVEFLVDADAKYADESFMRSFLEDEDSGLFMAYFEDTNNESMIFRFDPQKDEEVSLLREDKSPKRTVQSATAFIKDAPLDLNYTEIISSFRKKDERPGDCSLSYIKENELKLVKYVIDSNIDENGSFSAKATIMLKPRINDHHWINFRLYQDLTVDSVTYSDGKKIGFSKGENSPVLWIKTPEKFSKGSTFSINVFYHGNLLVKIEEFAWLINRSPDYWYPRYGNRQKANYELTFHSPKKYLLASVGDKISSTNTDDIATSKWVSEYPIRNASFNIGFFDDVNFPGSGIPNVDVYIGADGHGTGTKSKGEDVGADIVSSLQFFTKIFGPLNLKQLFVTEIPLPHGEAFPGLLHLDWSTFQSTGYWGYDEVFRAHEVAHQWWGIGVDFLTYHDQWLSEGFAEYSGLWYMQTILKDNDKYFKMLDQWKDDILNSRNYLFGKGLDAGPIYLGYRNSTTDTEGDYSRVVYEKGAWVLQMLRLMMIDLGSMKEDRFEAVLKDFYLRYNGTKASTSDFQKVVERYMGKDMSWFFNEWIYGSKIPGYTFAYTTQQGADGKFHVKCRVRSANVPDDFITMPVLKILFPGNKLARVRVTVTGNNYEFALPSLPMKPEDIIFNDLHSTLCEVDTEDWK